MSLTELIRFSYAVCPLFNSVHKMNQQQLFSCVYSLLDLFCKIVETELANCLRLCRNFLHFRIFLLCLFCLSIPKGAESVKIDGRRFFWKRLLLPYSFACHKFPEYAILPYEKLTLINFSSCLKGIGYLKKDAQASIFRMFGCLLRTQYVEDKDVVTRPVLKE